MTLTAEHPADELVGDRLTETLHHNWLQANTGTQKFTVRWLNGRLVGKWVAVSVLFTDGSEVNLRITVKKAKALRDLLSEVLGE